MLSAVEYNKMLVDGAPSAFAVKVACDRHVWTHHIKIPNVRFDKFDIVVTLTFELFTSKSNHFILATAPTKSSKIPAGCLCGIVLRSFYYTCIITDARTAW